jgi:hypothetical protein
MIKYCQTRVARGEFSLFGCSPCGPMAVKLSLVFLLVIANAGVKPVLGQPTAAGSWAQVTETENSIKIETDKIEAVIPKKNPKHWMTGIEKGSFLDKATGGREIGDGLMVVDWLMEPGSDEPYKDKLFVAKPGAGRFDPSGVGRYSWYENYDDPASKAAGNALIAHGSSYRKRSVEGPQLCHRMQPVQPRVVRGRDFVAVETTYRFEYAAPGRQAGSLWTQLIVFPQGVRYFLLMDRIDNINDVAELFLRNDTPGGIHHNKGDSFSEIYLSYLSGPKGVHIPASEFLTPFPPDLKFGYRRDLNKMPDHFIRAYRLRDKVAGKDGPWLGGVTLDSSMVYEAWTSSRSPGLLVLIQEVYGRPIKPGESFSTAYVVGFFDTVDEMHAVNERYKGCNALTVDESGWRLARYRQPFKGSVVAPR